MQPVLSEQAGKERKVTTAWGIRQKKVKLRREMPSPSPSPLLATGMRALHTPGEVQRVSALSLVCEEEEEEEGCTAPWG